MIIIRNDYRLTVILWAGSVQMKFGILRNIKKNK